MTDTVYIYTLYIIKVYIGVHIETYSTPLCMYTPQTMHSVLVTRVVMRTRQPDCNATRHAHTTVHSAAVGHTALRRVETRLPMDRRIGAG